MKVKLKFFKLKKRNRKICSLIYRRYLIGNADIFLHFFGYNFILIITGLRKNKHNHKILFNFSHKN